MPDDATTAAWTLVAVGALVAALGAYVRVRQRADLLANYHGATTPEYAAVHGGNAVAATGLFVAAYGAAMLVWGLPEWTVFVAALGVMAGALWAAARAQGY
ncbi:MAG: hypothetical protein ABEH83_14210 [Halobacterium sp.]